METIGERIKKIRKSKDMTQEEFAKRLGIKRNTVATYEVGKSDPSDSAVVLMCTVFNVNESWLRTGEGEPYVELTREKKIEDFFKDVELGSSEFKKAFIEGLAKLTTEEWVALEKICKKMTESISPVIGGQLEDTVPDNLDSMSKDDMEDIYKNAVLPKLSGKEHIMSPTSGEEKKAE